MYMYVIVCIYVYGPVAVNTINELNWIQFKKGAGWPGKGQGGPKKKTRRTALLNRFS